MSPPSRLIANAALRRLSACLQATTSFWAKNPSWRRYARAQHGRKSALRRLAVDLALLSSVALIPLAILFWNAESEQQQLARLPLEPTRYVEGWRMQQTQSHVFFDASSPTTYKPASQEVSDEASQEWSFRCGQLYETLSSRRPPSEEGAQNKQTRHSQCVEGAQMTIENMTLSTEALDYENRAHGYLLTTDRPVLVQGRTSRLSALGGGFVKENGNLRLFREVSFQALGLNINAQGEARGKNFFTKGFLLKKKHRAITFKRDVAFSFQAPLKRYHGTSQRMRLLFCSELSKVDCRIFENDALRLVTLKGTVVLAEEDSRRRVLWTLQAEHVVLQDEQARYHGKKRNGRQDSVRIVLADGTQLKGQRGGHDLVDDSGLLCGAVEVQSGESLLTAACLRYNLKEQRYSLESSTSEQELFKRFFAR